MASDEHGQFRFFANTSLKYAEMPMYKGFPMGEVWIEHLTQTSLTPHLDRKRIRSDALRAFSFMRIFACSL